MNMFTVTLEVRAPDREVLLHHLRTSVLNSRVLSVRDSDSSDELLPREEPPASRIEATLDWWLNEAKADANKVLEKAGEYSSFDLEIMGAVMQDWLKLAPAVGMEAACLFYVLGKVCRAIGSYKEGRAPSDDTLLDINQYTMMARRIREGGTWP